MDEIISFGPHKLILGDGYENIEYLKADAIITDPPYKFNNSGGGKFRKVRKASNKISEKNLDKGFLFKEIPWKRFKSAMVFCHNDQILELSAHLGEIYHRIAWLSYHKTNPSPMANKHYLADTEFYIHGWQHGYHPVGEHNDLRRFIVTRNGAQKQFDHPTVKPMDLMLKMAKNINGDVVLDPFMGTGSTGEALHKSGKTFIGIESDVEYYEMAVQRFTDLFGWEYCRKHKINIWV